MAKKQAKRKVRYTRKLNSDYDVQDDMFMFLLKIIGAVGSGYSW